MKRSGTTARIALGCLMGASLGVGGSGCSSADTTASGTATGTTSGSTMTTAGSGGAGSTTTASSSDTSGNSTSSGAGGAGGAGGASSAGLVIGTNIHPTQGPPGSDVTQTIADTQLIGFKHLRMDIGKFKLATDIPLMNKVIAEANAVGISVTVDVIISAANLFKNATPADAYTDGNTLTAQVVAAAPGNRTWECGNEYNNQTLIAGKDGHTYSDFDPKKIVLTREWLRGCIDAVHAGNPANKAVVNYSGFLGYGFMVGLYNGPQPDGGANLHWDISSIHHYNVTGGCMGQITSIKGHNALQIIHDLGPPIWVTEFHDNGCVPITEANAAQSATGNIAFMNNLLSLRATYDIETIDIYQLYDQGADLGMSMGFWTPSHGALKTAFSGPIQAFFAAHGNPAN
jgi:hypothetical protein